jgi:hypothetical protein
VPVPEASPGKPSTNAPAASGQQDNTHAQ